MILWSALVFLGVVVFTGYGFDAAVEFDLPKDSVNAYIGQLYKLESVVKLTPDLRAFTTSSASVTHRICGFRAIFKDELKFPFKIQLTDTKRGTGEIRLRDDIPMDRSLNKMYTFQMEAYDCDKPPNYSERVLVQINILTEGRLRFSQPEYNFTMATYSSVGEICGKVTVMYESSTHRIGGQDHCGYALLAGEMVPFSIDSHGVVRTQEVLTSASPRIYRFRVQYKDCGFQSVKTVTAVVNVLIVQANCEAQWKGLPQSVFYSANSDYPKRLLWPISYTLELCGITCEENARFVTQLSLQHAQAGRKLTTARTTFCRHDPRSLQEQRRLCEIDDTTIVDLLPDPRKSILEQHVSPAIGAPPEVIPLSLALRFSSDARSGWHLETSRLLNAAQTAQERVLSDTYQKPKVRPSNLFERDFTLSFWLQRNNHGDNEHETILCSQEDTVSVGRALWISLKDCQIMVQITTRNPQSDDLLTSKIFRIYKFPRLPFSLCGSSDHTTSSWHHYSISISVDPVTIGLDASTLMVDGELLGTLERFGNPIFVNRPTSEFFPQYITVGTCYDPSVPTAQQSLNGALAGMTLLLGKTEDHSVSRCLAECGEALLIPRAANLIKDDVNLLLNSDNILIESETSADAAMLIGNVAYVKPRSTDVQPSSQSGDSNERILELSTTYRCGEHQVMNISTARIPLTLLGSFSGPAADPIPNQQPKVSTWVPQNKLSNPVRPQNQAMDALVLGIIGKEIIYADIPVLEPGIAMFQGLEFTFTNAPSHTKAVAKSASMFMLDQCLVLPANGVSLDSSMGERIVWSAGRAFELGVNIEPLEMGILLKGRQTANQYASLLRGFRYWPPIEIEKPANHEDLVFGLMLERTFQLICSYDDTGYNVEPFRFRIILLSPIVAEEARAGKIVTSSDNSAADTESALARSLDDDDDYSATNEDDDDDEDEDFWQEDNPSVDSAGQWPLPHTGFVKQARTSYDPYKSAAQFAHSDKEVRPNEQLSLHLKEEAVQPGSVSGTNNAGLAIGVSLGCLAVLVVIVAFLVKKYRAGKPTFHLTLFGRSAPNGSGRLNLHPVTSLNVIENPIDKLEAGRLNLPSIVDVPVPILSTSLPRLPRGHALAKQLTSEMRSFNGLFGNEEEGDALESNALEEVDDFDASEVVVTQPVVGGVTEDLGNEEEEEEDGLSDQEDDTSFGMGPNHLEFVTLPSPHRGYNNDL